MAETNDKARDLVAVAGNNGPKMCVVSGDKDVVEAVIEAAGCTGKRGTRTHSWRQWAIRDGILIIDNYAKYVYEESSRQWNQADGKDNSFIR